MVVTQDPKLAERLRRVKGQGQSATRRYWHDELGFNYRMTNICAAIGLAQIERADLILARKREIAAFYRDRLSSFPVTLQQPDRTVISSEWLFSLLLPPGTDREAVMRMMAHKGVDTRPVFFCAHHMPMYKQRSSYPVSEGIAARGISLPSFPGLLQGELEQVVMSLETALSQHGS